MDNLTLSGQLSDIDRALQGDEVVIVHGMFTGSGHILVIRGMTDNGNYRVNDPEGEWFFDGYLRNRSTFEDQRGKNKIYSRRLIGTACGTFHLRDALDAYRMWSDDQVESVSNIWIHRISKI